MVLGPAGAGAPAGQHPALPDGEEWYAFGLTTNRWYHQMFLLIAMPQVVLPDGRRWDLTAPLTGLC